MPNDRGREIVFAELTDEPASTSDLYDRIGYPALMRSGLIAYAAFRETLVELEAQGRATSATDEDGATVWRRVP
jgi:hypothetical protein